MANKKGIDVTNSNEIPSVTPKIQALLGKTLLINKVQNKIHIPDDEVLSIVYTNMVNTFGKKAIWVFKVTQENLAQTAVIFSKYPNDYIK